jgi:peptidoglycan/LPS O-acetylase OafA/YrhL
MQTLVTKVAQPATGSMWVVEAWRGAAALLVLWAHWGPPLGWPGMGPQSLLRFAFTGVDLFFVLSGFVFAPLLLQRPAPSVRAFALRRVSRIYPAYLVALALYVLLAWQAGRPLLYVTEHLLMGHLQSREMTFYYNPAFWSLPAEVSFYAALPLLAVWLARGRAAVGGEGFGQGLRWLLLLGMALLLRLALLAGADGAAENLAWILLHHLPGLLVEFLMGVWVWQRAQQPLSRAGAWAWGLAGLAGWCGLAAVFVQLPASVQAGLGGQLALGAALCFALMLRATLLLPSGGVAVQALARWGGRLSYSVYLLHTAWLTPALVWVGRWGSGVGSVLALGALLMSCLALYWAAEEPMRRWGRALASRWERADMERAGSRSGSRAGSADKLRP